MLSMWTHLALVSTCLAFYLPGIAPKDYTKDDSVTLLVNRLTSEYVEGEDRESKMMSIDYYDPALGFCQPSGGPVTVRESLGSILFGDRIYTSPFEFKVLENVACREICAHTYDGNSIAVLVPALAYDYKNHWSIDGLPVSGAHITDNDIDVGLDEVPLGHSVFKNEVDGSMTLVKSVLANHFEFLIDFHELNDGNVRIVGAQVVATSRNNQKEGQCDAQDELIIYDMNNADAENISARFSYSVNWRKSEMPWATRWDKYLHVYEPSINWFALINSSVVVLFLSLLTSLVLTRMMRKDIANYNEVDLDDEISEEMGWKLVHGDVFRAPHNTMLYSFAAGTGAQVSFSVFTTTAIAMLGLISPATRGWFSTSLLLFACLGGAVGGYVSAACYKIWGGESWKKNLLFTPVHFPSVILGMFLLVNLLMIGNHSSSAVPFGSILAVVGIWTLIATPLSIVFGMFSCKKNWGEFPVRVNQIPRQIPPQPWYLHLVPVSLVGGLLGFLSISVQLYYIYSAIWFQKLYYMFGFLFTSLFCMVLISVIFNALVLYLTLKSENYHWQWRSFMVTGSPAIYFFIYSVVYMVRYMHLSTISGKLIYIAYCFMGCGLAYLALGFFGAMSSYFLVKKMYSRIKMD